MTDEEMKNKILHVNGEEIAKHAAAVASFCLAYDVPLEKGVEIAIDLLGDGLKVLISSGAIDMAEKYCKQIKSELSELNEKLRAGSEGENEKDKGDDSIHDAES